MKKEKGGAAMPVMDEFKAERETIKQKSTKEKISYFFDYYKWHTVAVVVILAAAISLIVHLVNLKDRALYVCLLNATAFDQTDNYIQHFEEYAGIDQSEYEAIFDTSMSIEIGGRDTVTATSFQKMAVYTAAGDLDVIITNPEIIEYYVEQGLFYDLRQLLSPEQIALYEPYFFYVDQVVLNAIQDANDRDETYDAVFSDPRQPEAMTDPIPVGIVLDDCQRLKESVLFGDEELVLSVIINSSNVETALKFIDFVMQEP